MAVHASELITEKKVSAPMSIFELLAAITHPFASAKSAIDQINDHTAITNDIM